MAKASIHFSPIKGNSEAHNERSTKLDYNYPDLEKNNENFILERVDARTKAINSHCKKVSGRKLQKNAEPVREAVVNLNANHTLEDLKRLSKVLKEKKGIDCFQIHIHRDEGKSRDEINYHAHMIFDWQDKESGKMIRLDRADLSQIQTIVADTLNMERGELRVNSNRERLEAVEYKRHQEELKAKEAEIRAKEAHIKVQSSKALLDDIRDDFTALEGKKKLIFNEASSVIVKKDNLGVFKTIDESNTILNISGLIEQNKALRTELYVLKRDHGNKMDAMSRDIESMKTELIKKEKSIRTFKDWTEFLGKCILLGNKISPQNTAILERLFPSIAEITKPKPQVSKEEVQKTQKNNPKKGLGM